MVGLFLAKGMGNDEVPAWTKSPDESELVGLELKQSPPIHIVELLEPVTILDLPEFHQPTEESQNPAAILIVLLRKEYLGGAFPGIVRRPNDSTPLTFCCNQITYTQNIFAPYPRYICLAKSKREFNPPYTFLSSST